MKQHKTKFHPYYLLENIFKVIMIPVGLLYQTMLVVWLLVAQCCFIWMFVVLLIPDVSFYEHANNILQWFIMQPAEAILDYFIAQRETLSAMDWGDNPIRNLIFMLLFTGSIVMSVGAPLYFLIMWLVFSVAALVSFFPMEKRLDVILLLGGNGRGMSNWDFVLTGNATIQQTFDAEVIANAIKSK